MKREALEHPKLHLLAAELAEHAGVPNRWSLLVGTGLLERMWGFAGKQKIPDGAFDRPSLAHLARNVGWPGRANAMIDVLVRCRLLDQVGDTFIIHGWSEHCDRWVHRKLVRSGKSFADGKMPNASYANTKERGLVDELPDGQPGVQPAGRPHARSRSQGPEEENQDRTVPFVPSVRSMPKDNGTNAREQTPLSEEEQARVLPLVEDIITVTGDNTPRSRPYWIYVARELDEQVIRRELSDLKQAKSVGTVRNPAALFTDKVSKLLERQRKHGAAHA